MFVNSKGENEHVYWTEFGICTLCVFLYSVIRYLCALSHLSNFSSRVCVSTLHSFCFLSTCDESVCVCWQGCACLSISLCAYLPWRVTMHVCVRLSCHVALCVGVSVDLRSLTHTPPLRGPRWVRWVSTHGVHGLDHSCCCGDVSSLLLQAVGLLVDRLYLDVWFTEGDTPPTWKRSTTFGQFLAQCQNKLRFS